MNGHGIEQIAAHEHELTTYALQRLKEIPHIRISVSYTHLDVYKRQGLNGAPAAGDTFHVVESDQEAREITNKREQLAREQGLRTQKILTSVSYTHLDVYKRQV